MTVLRNLMKGIQEPSNSIAVEYKSIATVVYLHQLKRAFPDSVIKHGDIHKHTHMYALKL